jgi:hypothetical protein
MKPNTPESIRSNVIEQRASSLWSARNRGSMLSLAAVTLSLPASHRRRTDADCQRLVALLDEAIRITSGISFPSDTRAPAQRHAQSLPPPTHSNPEE